MVSPTLKPGPACNWPAIFEAFDALLFEAHDNAVVHGFRAGPSNIPQELCLMHSEISEALEVYRDNHPVTGIWFGEKGKPEGFGVELADLLIRVLDTAHALGINLAECVRLKMAYNRSRPPLHGGKRC